MTAVLPRLGKFGARMGWGRELVIWAGVAGALVLLITVAALSYRSIVSFEASALIIVLGNVASLAVLAAAFLLLRREIAGRRAAQAEVERYARELDDLYNNAPCGHHSVDRNGVFVRMNDTELAWLGYTRDEVIGRLRHADVMTPESAEAVKRNLAKFLTTGELYNAEYTYRRKDGTTFVGLVDATAIRDARGEVALSRTTIVDVTARKRAEEKLRGLLESAPDGVVLIDDAGRIALVNSQTEGLFGYRRDELLGQPAELLVPERFRSWYREHRGRFVANPKLWARLTRFELYGLRRDGSEFPAAINLSPIATDEGVLVFISIRDVTRRRAMEGEVRRLNDELRGRAGELEAANKELESFSYSVSHDLRAPLRAIDGFSRMLEEDYGEQLDGEGRRLLGVVRESTGRMAHLIDNLLQFAQVGRQQLTRPTVDMTALAREVAAEIVAAGEQPQPAIEFGSLPSACGDPALLRQVWSNLIGNAVKYSAKRERPAIEVGGQREAERAIYWVKDNGAGFDMRYAYKLFGVFQRLHRQADFGGTGVGLAIVQRVIARHGGEVWAEGQPDAGASFYFSLPMRRSADS